jgi:hypothetical protein
MGPRFGDLDLETPIWGYLGNQIPIWESTFWEDPDFGAPIGGPRCGDLDLETPIWGVFGGTKVQIPIVGTSIWRPRFGGYLGEPKSKFRFGNPHFGTTQILGPQFGTPILDPDFGTPIGGP